jgi:aminopeptidase C
MDDKTFQDTLRRILRNTNDMISVYELSKRMMIRVDPLLEMILVIQRQYNSIYKDNLRNMLKGDKQFMEQFFKEPVVDLGMLLQHKVREINEPLKDKINSMGHQMFYNNWLLYRGY